jgi:RNA polymerase sigma-70 factor (ECF subfamily)
VATDDRPTGAALSDRPLDAAEFVRRYYPALLRFANFEGANEVDVNAALQDAWAAAAAEPDEPAFRRRVVRELLGRVASMERDAGRELGSFAPDPEPVVPAAAFNGPDAAWAGFFRAMPLRFARLEPGGPRAAEASVEAERALRGLPLAHRAVVVLTDVAGWPADEAAAILGIDTALGRNLLHAGRGRVRRALEDLVEPRRKAARG